MEREGKWENGVDVPQQADKYPSCRHPNRWMILLIQLPFSAYSPPPWRGWTLTLHSMLIIAMLFSCFFLSFRAPLLAVWIHWNNLNNQLPFLMANLDNRLCRFKPSAIIRLALSSFLGLEWKILIDNTQFKGTDKISNWPNGSLQLSITLTILLHR